MNNKYYFREDYTTPEKIDRISSSKINAGVDGFDSALQDFGLDPTDYRGYSKSDFFTRMREELDEVFDDFVNNLFQLEGKKGDKFNLQIIELPPERVYDNVAEAAQTHEGSRLDNVIDGISNILTLNACDSEGDFPTLGFRTAQRVEEIEPDEELPIIIRDAEGNIEAEYPEGYQVEAPIRNNIEARAYPSANFIVISNSGIKTGIQKDIARFVVDQAEPQGDQQ